jgi:hypothetical protein
LTEVNRTLLIFSFLLHLTCFAQKAELYTVVAGSGNVLESVELITSKVISSGLEAKTIDFSTPQKVLFRSCSGLFTVQKEAIKHKTNLITRTGIRDAWVLRITPDIAGFFPKVDLPTDDQNDKKDQNQQNDVIDSIKGNEGKPELPNNKPFEQQGPEYLSKDKLEEVIRIYKEINKSISSNNISQIEKYIDPETGIIEIIDPDGIPYPIYSSSLKQAFAQRLFISFGKSDPVIDYLPEFDCNIGMWTKTGVFVSSVKKYSGVSNILPDAKNVIYIDKLLLNAIENIEYRISVIILSTDESLLAFFNKGGSWYLGVVDNSFSCVE